MTSWVVLDRDGVINAVGDGCIRSLEQWQPLPGAIEAIAALSRAGWHIAVASNQSGVGQGLIELADLDAIHQQMCRLVSKAGGDIEGVFYCPHTRTDACNCRKPRTGMFDAIETRFAISLAGAYCVGDSLKDLQAAEAKGCQPVLVRTGKGTQTETTTLLWPKYGRKLQVFDNLPAFAQHLLE